MSDPAALKKVAEYVWGARGVPESIPMDQVDSISVVAMEMHHMIRWNIAPFTNEYYSRDIFIPEIVDFWIELCDLFAADCP